MKLRHHVMTVDLAKKVRGIEDVEGNGFVVSFSVSEVQHASRFVSRVLA